MTSRNPILIRMRQILTSPTAWTKGELARDANNRPVRVSNPLAVCFCMMGARRQADGTTGSSEATEALFALERVAVRLFAQRTGSAASVPFQRLSWFNDHPETTHADVLKVIDEALTI